MVEDGMDLSLVGLPPEIHRFFQHPGGHSLIVKGKAGTGKTTLVLQMLEEIFSGLDNFYLSSRVSDTSLYKQFPWLLSKERNERLSEQWDRWLHSGHARAAALAAELTKTRNETLNGQ